MSNNTRKIVVLRKIDSPRIEQAIFILRDEAEISESDALTEAQKIVDNYVRSLSTSLSPPKKRNKPIFFFSVALYTLATAMITAYIMTIAG